VGSPGFRFLIISFMLVLSFGLSYIVSGRDSSIGSDTYSYQNFYYYFLHGSDYRISEPLFILLADAAAWFSNDHRLFFFLISFLSSFLLFFFSFKAYEALAPERNKRIGLFVGWFIALSLISPFFANGQVNLLRSALAVPFAFAGYLLFYQRRYTFAIVMASVAVMFHFTHLMFLPLLPLILLRRQYLLFAIVVLACCYALGITQGLFSSFSSLVEGIERFNYYAKYGGDVDGYRTGVRYDFLLFSLLFLFAFYYSSSRSNLLDFAFRIYAVSLTPFLLIGFIAYSDRLLFSAWLFIPFGLSCYLVYVCARGELVLAPVLCFFVMSVLWFTAYSGIMDYRVL